MTIMTEADLAALRIEEGRTVVGRDGRYWVAIFPGFFQPVHLLARHRLADAAPPTRFRWGFRSALPPDEFARSNAAIPLHRLSDLDGYGEATLGESRRRDLRKCGRAVEFVRLRDPDLVATQGYGVFRSAQRRVPYWPEMTERQYRERMSRHVLDPRRFIVGGLVDGRLGGYLESYAVDGVLYADELFVATEVMRTGIGTGLYYETIQAGARAGLIREACLGLHVPERSGLTAFKEGLGFPVERVPAHMSIPGPLRGLIRARRPGAHYRLTGSAGPLAPIGMPT